MQHFNFYRMRWVISILLFVPVLCFGQISHPGALHASATGAAPATKITVRIPDASISESHTNFIAYVDLTEIATEASTFWDSLQTDFSDLRVFESDGTTPLYFDTISADHSASAGVIAVEIDLTDGQNNDFIVDWTGSGSSLGRSFHDSTWLNWKFVYFTVYTGNLPDRTGKCGTMTPNNLESGDRTAGGYFDYFVTIDGVNEYWNTADDPDQDKSYPLTWYTMMEVPSQPDIFPCSQNSMRPISKYTTLNSNKQYTWVITDDDPASNSDISRYGYYNGTGGGGGINSSTGIVTAAADDGHHLFSLSKNSTASSDSLRFYRDDTQYGNSATATFVYTGGSADLELGRIVASSTLYGCAGVSMIGYENASRTKAFLFETWDCLSAPGTFYTFIY